MSHQEQSPPGVDLEATRRYLDDQLPGLVNGPLSAERITGGRSNLTYIVRDGQRSWVLRRPPLGHVQATAHDMSREYRVLSALQSSAVPVPHVLLHCEDSDVLGAPFYVMEHVPGTVMRSGQDSAALSPDQAHRLGVELIDVLAELHNIDPGDVGLQDFGKPDGFMQRQLRRWGQQLEGSRSRHIAGIDELQDHLQRRLPQRQQAPAIVHGDYRLDNVILTGSQQIAAVLDWEMATLGDPLADLGLLQVYWSNRSVDRDAPIPNAVVPGRGFPDIGELFERYADRTGRDLTELDFYVAFGHFKLAVVLEGIHYRYRHGQTVGEGFAHIGEMVEPLVAGGLAAIGTD